MIYVLVVVGSEYSGVLLDDADVTIAKPLHIIMAPTHDVEGQGQAIRGEQSSSSTIT